MAESMGGIGQAVGSVIGDILGFSANKSSAKKEYQRQKEFAQNQIQWRVKDAQAAGIHPLFALGSQGIGYSPSAMVSDFSNMGQDIGRALYQTATARERRSAEHAQMVRMQYEDDITRRKNELELENMRLNNGLLASELARSAQVGPAPQDPAAPGTADLMANPVIAGRPGTPSISPGEYTDTQIVRSGDNRYALIPSEQTGQTIQDTPMMWQWFWRNNISPPREAWRQLPRAPSGQEWAFNAITGEFYLRRSTRGRPVRAPAWGRGRMY